MLIVFCLFVAVLFLVWAAGHLPAVLDWTKRQAANLRYWLKGRR